MTTGDEGRASSRPLLKRTVDLVRASQARYKLGALGAVVLLVSAPFGGLDKVDSPDLPLEQDVAYDIGPVEVTITGVSSVPTLEPSVEPAPGNRLFAVRMDVRNITDQPFYLVYLTDALGGTGTGAVPFPGDDVPRPQILNVEDGQPLGEVNPGVEYDIALVLEQAGDWEPGEVELSLGKFFFQAEDPFTADPARWRLGPEKLVGDFTVRVQS